MHGNVMEWCHDFYAQYNEKSPNIDPLARLMGVGELLEAGVFIGLLMIVALRREQVMNLPIVGQKLDLDWLLVIAYFNSSDYRFFLNKTLQTFEQDEQGWYKL